MLLIMYYSNYKITDKACPDMGLKVLVPLLTICVILPWSSGNPNPVALRDNVARSMDDTRDKLHDENGENTHLYGNGDDPDDLCLARVSSRAAR